MACESQHCGTVRSTGARTVMSVLGLACALAVYLDIARTILTDRVSRSLAIVVTVVEDVHAQHACTRPVGCTDRFTDVFRQKPVFVDGVRICPGRPCPHAAQVGAS